MTDLKPEDLVKLREIAEKGKAALDHDGIGTMDMAIAAARYRETFTPPTVLSLLADRARMEKALRRLLVAAENMPRRTPAPGGCGTVHTFEIEAGAVWDNDGACKEARQALGASQ